MALRPRAGPAVAPLIPSDTTESGLHDGPSLMDPRAESQAIAMREHDGGTALEALWFVDLHVQLRSVVGRDDEFAIGIPLEGIARAEFDGLDAF